MIGGFYLDSNLQARLTLAARTLEVAGRGRLRHDRAADHLPCVVSTEEIFLAILVNEGTASDLDKSLGTCRQSRFDTRQLANYRAAALR